MFFEISFKSVRSESDAHYNTVHNTFEINTQFARMYIDVIFKFLRSDNVLSFQ